MIWTLHPVLTDNLIKLAWGLVNGFTTESINIEQSVKQGDALSCSFFILCMDPLIRKVNDDNEIEGLNIGINGECID